MEQAELRTIEYLTSRMRQIDITEMREYQGQRYVWGEVGRELDNI